MVGPEGLELIVNPLNYLSNTQHAQIVTVKATVKSAGFGWTGLVSVGRVEVFPIIILIRFPLSLYSCNTRSEVVPVRSSMTTL